MDWLEAGDRNSKYFHSKARSRKKKNLIASLQDFYGQPQASDEGMASMINEFFGSLFTSSNPSKQLITKATDPINTHLTVDLRLDFSLTFSEEEVKTAVFSMSPIKALGPDGFQTIFF